ncbi:uncharacterized protein LOC132561119 [Ylistrum balloti]|uniref:uncharacterized protein LOC132561119 n=1 Tax=Ylistrum balloti TaxID=509963 RepID=UPI002905B947|nr:uncharacterized protein LOC132561119 [Ylistrum balloti]
MALQAFLQYIDDRYSDLHMDISVVEHMYRATKDIVQYLVAKIGELDPCLTVNEILSVGSFVEKTKIRSPNEFDFMVCLDFLSNEDVVKIEAQEGCDPGYMIAFLKSHPKNMKRTAMQLYGDVWCIHPDGLRAEYNRLLTEVFNTIKDYKVITPHGAMKVRGSFHLALKLEWIRFRSEYTGDDVFNGLSQTDIPFDGAHRLPVDVDIMPAVRVENASLATTLSGFPRHMADVVTSQGFHLIYKASGHDSNTPFLQTSFAASEVVLVQKLHPIHKQCYRILKYLLTDGTNVNKQNKNISLSSYMFKTAVLFHEYDGLCRGVPDIVKCSLNLINYVKDNFGLGLMPTFFMRNRNTWGKSYRIPIMYSWNPSGLPHEVSRDELCVIMWMEVWRQILNKAILIFQNICRYNATKTALQSSGQNNVYQRNNDSNTVTENIHKTVSHTDSVKEKESKGDCQSNTYNETHGEEASSANKTCHRPGTGVLLYQFTANDNFVEAFQKLRNTICSVTGLPPEKALAAQTEPEIWKLVVPKFSEYHAVMEKACQEKIDIPNEEPMNLELKEIVYSRESFD